MTTKLLFSIVPFLAFQVGAQAATNTYQTTTKTTTTQTGSSTGQAANPTLTDGQIAEVVLAINEGEIAAGKEAKDHAQNESVKSFAAMMVDHHKDNKDETKKVAKEQKIKTANSDLSKALASEAKTSNRDLKKSAKAEFDKAYLVQQIAMHEKALATLNDVLIPQATNSAFRAHLEMTQKSVSDHLQKAKDLQTQVATR